MTQNNAQYSVNTYRDILQTLHDIEIEDDEFREKRFWVCLFSIILVIFFLIVYAYQKESIEIFYSGDTVKVFLIPIFSYLFMSLQEDSISERRANLFKSFRDLYNDNETVSQQLKETAMTDEELREIVKELIKQKLQ